MSKGTVGNTRNYFMPCWLRPEMCIFPFKCLSEINSDLRLTSDYVIHSSNQHPALQSEGLITAKCQKASKSNQDIGTYCLHMVKKRKGKNNKQNLSLHSDPLLLKGNVLVLSCFWPCKSDANLILTNNYPVLVFLCIFQHSCELYFKHSPLEWFLLFIGVSNLKQSLQDVSNSTFAIYSPRASCSSDSLSKLNRTFGFKGLDSRSEGKFQYCLLPFLLEGGNDHQRFATPAGWWMNPPWRG